MKQFSKYDEMELNDELEDSAKSSIAHNIDAETIMGIYSAAQISSPNLNYISSHIPSQKWNISIYRK